MTSEELERSKESNIQFWDGARAFFGSSRVPVMETIIMLVMIQVFHADTFDKTAMSVLLKVGFIFGWPMMLFFSRRSLKKNQILALMLVLSGIFWLLAAAVTQIHLFIMFNALATLFPLSMTPILAEIYGEYRRASRGKRFITTAIITSVATLLWTWISSCLMGNDPARYPLIYIMVSICSFAAAICASRLSVGPLAAGKTMRSSQLIAVLRRDHLFAYVLSAWFLLGFANLWLLPYRTNLLVEEQYHFCYSPQNVMFLLVILPEGIRILLFPLAGWLFDRINFILMRILLSTILALYVLLFFMGNSWIFHFAGMVCYGMALSGGAVSWSLWVTRIAPKEEIATYMMIHSGATGVRMILGPAVGLVALENLGSAGCAWVSIAFLATSITMLTFVLPQGKIRFNN